ncbi:hypothetical protein CEXT_67401 [Caerostris extrusa]|uniref:Uncharacterized protein n=1 Tax=Caerostris extrusa TaxID=172846 RepID=A0AAV4XQE4_CAEEX|nr:hypothetical protein CEXT_67401 [Caerostris extrusa]
MKLQRERRSFFKRGGHTIVKRLRRNIKEKKLKAVKSLPCSFGVARMRWITIIECFCHRMSHRTRCIYGTDSRKENNVKRSPQPGKSYKVVKVHHLSSREIRDFPF